MESVCRLTAWLQRTQGLTVFWTGTRWFWTGTHDFSQDESQDSPSLFVTKITASVNLISCFTFYLLMDKFLVFMSHTRIITCKLNHTLTYLFFYIYSKRSVFTLESDYPSGEMSEFIPMWETNMRSEPVKQLDSMHCLLSCQVQM